MSDHQENDKNLVGLGPLAGLIGVWEGNSGVDISPGLPDHALTDTESGYRERWAMELVSPAVENHDQKLRQLTCATNAWRCDPSTAGHTRHQSYGAPVLSVGPIA